MFVRIVVVYMVVSVEEKLVLVQDHCWLVMTLMRMMMFVEKDHCWLVRVMMLVKDPVVQLQ